MSSKKPLAKPVSTQKTDLAALRKASKLPLANPDKQEEEKLLSDVAAEEAQDTPVQLAAAPGTVVSDASPAGAHSVGDAHAAHAAQPAAQASGMGALSSNWLLGAAGFGLVAAAASGGGGGGSSPAATPTPSQQGTAIDGYVVGADVYLDTNNNHQLDAGDTKVGTTGKGGSFSVSNPNKLDVFVKGGFNDSNQNGTKDAGELDNTVVLKATGGTSGNFIVSPLTTLVQELLRQSPQTTQKAAESTIKAALGLDQAIDLTTFDPLAAGNTANALAAYKAAVQVATALDIAADEQAFLQALVSKLTANTTPGASGILVSSITAAFTGSTDNNVTSTELLNKLELIGSATSIGNITESQAQVNNDKEVAKPVFTLNSDTGSSQTDNITSDKVVKVTLAADVASWEYSLKGGEWTKGTGTSFNLADNATYAAGEIKVRQTDKAGNVSEVANNAVAITVDNAVSQPTFALNDDTGISKDDGITNNGVVKVTLASDVASWKYSVDGGTNWNVGEGDSFTLVNHLHFGAPFAGGTTYASGDIRVSQTDKAGNISVIFSNEAAITVDTTVAAPSFALRTDSGAQGDGLTNDPVINVTLADDVAAWGYVLDGSTEYIRGTGTSFTLDPNTTYAPGQIRVIQADKAGNISVVFSNEAAITVDTTVGLPPLSLHDTGISDSDYITKDNVVTVTPADDVDFWKYSLDGGKTWNDGEGTSFNLAQNTTYNSGDIKVYQVDKAGNKSGIQSFAITIQTDNTVEAPAFALNSDSGIADDLITNDNVVNVTLAQDVASWQYSLKGGDWVQGTGTSFNLEDNTSYAVGDIRVRQTDKAGNVSEAASNTLRIIEDSLVEAPTVALLNDTGASTSDKVTSSATLNVTTTEPGGVVEYTLDGGKNWLSQLEYAAAVANDGNYTVAVRQTDMAGNVSAASTPLAFTLSKAVPAAAISSVQFLERMELGAQDAEYVLKVGGTHMTSLLTGSAVTGDVTAQLNFSKLSWKLDGSNTVSLANGIEKAEVISDTEMRLHLTVAKYEALVASGALLDSVDRVSDSLVIDSGFLVSASGVANTANYTASALGSAYQLDLGNNPEAALTPLVYASQIELSGSGKFATDNAQTPALDITVSGSGTVEVSVLGSKATDLVFDAHQTGGSITLNLDALAVGGDGGLVQNSGTGELKVYLNDNVNQVAMEGSMTIYQVGEGGNITLGMGSQHIAVYEDHATDLNLSGFESGVDKVVLDVDFLNAQFDVPVFTPGQQLSDFTLLNAGIFYYDANTGVLTLDADDNPGTTNITLLHFEAGTQLQTSDFLVAKIV